MMIVKKKRVANPQAKRRKLTAKQIKHFGTKRQKAALKAKRKNGAKRKIKRNPAQLITLGFMNPHKTKTKRKNSMATKTKKRRKVAKASNPIKRRRRTVKAKASNPVKRRRRVNSRRKKNSTRIVVTSPRKRNGRSYRRKRNPELFGRSVGVTEMAKQVLGGLVGVTITKAVPGMLPAVATSSPILTTLTSVVTAFAAGWGAGKLMPDIGSAVLFGGLMQAGSVLLNQFLPSVGGTLGLSGLGNIVGPARFSVPQNPLLLPAGTVVSAPVSGASATGGATPRVGVSGIGRAFRPAF